jgi:hypothetical protein
MSWNPAPGRRRHVLGDPLSVGLELVAGESNRLDVSLGELGLGAHGFESVPPYSYVQSMGAYLELGDLSELGGADGREVTEHRLSQHPVRPGQRRQRASSSTHAGWEKRTAHEVPIHSWKEMLPYRSESVNQLPFALQASLLPPSCSPRWSQP